MKFFISFSLVFIFLLFTKEEVFASDFSRPNFRVILNDRLVEDYAKIYNDNIYISIENFAKLNTALVEFDTNLDNIYVEHNDKKFLPPITFLGDRAYTTSNFINLMFGYEIDFLEELNILLIYSEDRNFDISILREIIPLFSDYSEQDLLWLSRIIYAEARGENFEGMLAVGNVVINRKNHASYPNTIRDVIFDRRNGVQFSPTINGSINNNPCIRSFIAAVEALEGRRNASEALFFINPRISRSSWVANNRNYAFTVQNHAFFY
ncbi:MAG: cell wall hydrolase [Defluviitaleaceae bacterium]|nr:cell wall hydrolase [Defluviitaleaceae bacterium]